MRTNTRPFRFSRDHYRTRFYVIFFIITLCILISLRIFQLHKYAEDSAKYQINTLGILMADQTDRNIQNYENFLNHLDNLISANISSKNTDIKSIVDISLPDNSLYSTKFLSIYVCNSDGIITYQTTDNKYKITCDLSDKNYQYHKNNANSPMYISEVMQDTTSGSLTVNMTRRISAPDGSFLGFIGAYVRLSYFEEIFSKIAPQSGFGFSLIRNDGLLLARYPEYIDNNVEKFPPQSEWYAKVAQGGGIYRSPGYLDPRGGRLVSVHPLSTYPAVVNAYRFDRDIFAAWRHQAAQIIVIALIAILGAVLLLRKIEQQFRTLEISQESINKTANELIESRSSTEQQSRLLQTTLEHMNQGLMMVDADGIVAVCNQHACDILNLPQQMMAKRPSFRDVVAYQESMGDFADKSGPLPKLVGTGEFQTQQPVYERRRPNGRTMEIRSMPLKGGGMVRTYTDITERRATEQALLRTERLHAVGALTGGVAHDFNNLLTVISLNLEMLADKLAVDPDGLELLTPAIRAARDGAELTSRLLSFARLQPLQPESLDLAALLPAWQTLMSRSIGERHRLVLHVAADIQPCLVDRAQLEAALLNLILNARDALPDGGNITISADMQRWTPNERREPGHEPDLPDRPLIRLRVHDEGSGIPAEIIDRVFEPFVTTKPVGQGTGLGLSMVSGFARQSGGAITLDSAPGRGTTVSLYLPFSPLLPAIARQKRKSSWRPPAWRVLIVEDQQNVLASVTQLCRSLGLVPVQASSAEAAMAILRDDTPLDLLFTDMVLPGMMGGSQIAVQAVACRPSLRVLLTSGHSTEIAGQTLPATMALLQKPYSAEQFLEAIRRTMTS